MKNIECLLPFLAAAALLSSPASGAQEPGPTLGGPAVPGVCLLGREAIFANAKVGASATEQLQRLVREAEAQFDAERQRIDAELASPGLAGAAVPESQPDDRQRAALEKLQALRQRVAERNRRIEQARAAALQRISEEAQPVIAEVYARRGCGLLLDRNVVLGGNTGNDLTGEVVQGLDARIETVPVSL